MKVKVTHEDKSIVLDIPADKAMVLLDASCRFKGAESKDCADIVRFIEDHGDVVEIQCDEDGEAALFYKPVWVTDFASSENTEDSRISCGYATWVGLPGVTPRPEGSTLEEQFLRHEGGFDIITTPRAIVQVSHVNEKRLQEPTAGNYRSAVDLGSFSLSRGHRLSEGLLEEVFAYLKVPREEGKDYSMHAIGAGESLFFSLAVRNDPDWCDSPNRDSKGYWDNVGLFRLFSCFGC